MLRVNVSHLASIREVYHILLRMILVQNLRVLSKIVTSQVLHHKNSISMQWEAEKD